MLHKSAMGTAMVSTCFLFFIVLNRVYSSTEFVNDTYVEPEYLENLLATGQYEEFARLLRINDVNLVRPAEGESSDDPMLNKGVKGGDVLSRSWQGEEATEGQFGASDDGISRWNKVVPYVISKKGYTVLEMAEILEAITKWNRDLFRYVRYRPRANEKDYVMIFSGNGCYSYLGRVGGQQPISLRANGCLSQGTILHEMSHAVGIIHEHTRPNRDDYIEILPQNIPEQWQSQYDKVKDYPNLGPYDYYSVMHYPVEAPETDLPAFKVLEENVDLDLIGQRVAQTNLDKDKIKKLYTMKL